mgnify:CR=1 FL=1
MFVDGFGDDVFAHRADNLFFDLAVLEQQKCGDSADVEFGRRGTVRIHIELADQLGYVEAWVGEHFTVPWEPICAPDLLLAQALLRTKSIKLAPGAHLMPYHHPVELAHRVAYFDHLAQGRVMLGVGPGALVGDAYRMGIDPEKQRQMMNESLDVVLQTAKALAAALDHCRTATAPTTVLFWNTYSSAPVVTASGWIAGVSAVLGLAASLGRLLGRSLGGRHRPQAEPRPVERQDRVQGDVEDRHPLFERHPVLLEASDPSRTPLREQPLQLGTNTRRVRRERQDRRGEGGEQWATRWSSTRSTASSRTTTS